MINNYKFHKVDYSHQSVHCLSNQMTDNPHRTLTFGPTWSISARSTWPNHLAGRRGRPCSLNLKSPRVQMRKKERRGGGTEGGRQTKGQREREKKRVRGGKGRDGRGERRRRKRERKRNGTNRTPTRQQAQRISTRQTTTRREGRSVGRCRRRNDNDHYRRPLEAFVY